LRTQFLNKTRLIGAALAVETEICFSAIQQEKRPPGRFPIPMHCAWAHGYSATPMLVYRSARTHTPRPGLMAPLGT